MALVSWMLCASLAPAAGSTGQPQAPSPWVSSVFPIGVEERGRFVALGTAFAIDAKGTVVTHLNVVAGAREMVLKGPDGNLLTADTAVAVDPRAQLAILEFAFTSAKPLKLGGVERVLAGRELTVVGAPHILDHVVTSNRVSRVSFLGGGRKRIELESPLQPGTMGAPVVDLRDRVIGVALLASHDGVAVHSMCAVEELKRLLHRRTKAKLRSIKLGPARGFIRTISAGEPDAQLRPPRRIITAKMSNTGITHFNLSLALIGDGRAEVAAQELTRALHSNPYMADAHNNLGLLLGQRGDLEGALRSYGAALALAPSNLDYCCNLALTYCHAGRYGQAEVVVQRCLAREAQHPRARAILGMALVGQDKSIDTAIEHLREALARDPTLTWGLGILATAFARRGRLVEAIDYGRQAVQASPRNPRLRVNLAEFYVAKQMLSEAIGSYEQATALQPDSSEIRERLGDLLVEAGRRDEALQAYQHALRTDKGNAALSKKAEALQQGAGTAGGPSASEGK